MHNQADVRPVNAHAEGIGGCDDVRPTIEKGLLDTASLFILEPSMIPQCLDAFPVETSDNRIDSLSGSSIDNGSTSKSFEPAGKVRKLFF
jgi:hypothetical protein